MLKVGLLDDGSIGNVHAKSISSNPDSKLVAVSDVDKQAAAKLAAPIRRRGAQHRSDHRRRLDQRRPYSDLDRHPLRPDHGGCAGWQGGSVRKAGRPQPRAGEACRKIAARPAAGDDRLQPPLRSQFRRAQAAADRGEIGKAGCCRSPLRPRAAAGHLCQGVGRAVPRHDDPRLRHGALDHGGDARDR